MKQLFTVLLCLFAAYAPGQTARQGKVLEGIRTAMAEQENCWNSGDIPCFMKHYWNSDSLRFIGKSGLTYGWQKTLDNYLKSYPDRAAMGRLTFHNLVVEFIDKNTVSVIGRWTLERGAALGDLQGHYSLLWQKKNGAWVIVADHSS